MEIVELFDKNEIYETLKGLKESFYDSFDDLEAYANKISVNAKVFACVDKSPVGIIAFYANDLSSLTAYITLITVNKNSQGKGIGRSLLAKTKSYCVDKNFRRIKLEVNKRNKNAIDFYLKNDFYILSECSERSLYMQTDL